MNVGELVEHLRQLAPELPVNVISTCECHTDLEPLEPDYLKPVVLGEWTGVVLGDEPVVGRQRTLCADCGGPGAGHGTHAGGGLICAGCVDSHAETCERCRADTPRLRGASR